MKKLVFGLWCPLMKTYCKKIQKISHFLKKILNFQKLNDRLSFCMITKLMLKSIFDENVFNRFFFGILNLEFRIYQHHLQAMMKFK